MLDFAKEVQVSLPKLRTPEPQRSGTLVRLVGLTLETRGIMAPLGACCEVIGKEGHRVEAEVVGFNDKTLYLMPFTDPVGVGPGDTVRIMSNSGQVRLGNELLGRVIDGRGVPIDGKPMPHLPDQLSLLGCPLNPMERGPIEEILDVGVKAINGALTIGRGQRIGLVAGSGVGKSVLLGMLTRFTKADIVVIGLIGERGREVQAFIHESLGEEGLAKSVVIAAPANVSPVLRLKATHMTHVIAEYFRDQGKKVLFLMDSVTRFAMAQREIGLAAGEPPATKGYTPTVFAELPRLLERAGPGLVGQGAITGVFTVLVDGDDHNEPVADAVRGILDGHVVMSRKIAERGRYPAVDVLKSVSRTLPRAQTDEENAVRLKARDILSLYGDMEEIVRLGAYRHGANPDVDRAINLAPQIEKLLSQGKDDRGGIAESFQALGQIEGSE